MFKKFFHRLAIFFLCFSFAYSSHCMGSKSFQEGITKRIIINSVLSNNNKDKGLLDYVFDYLWLQFLFASPSATSNDNQEVNSHEKIVDFKPRARLLTKLARLEDVYNLTRQETHIKKNSETELAGLTAYKQYLQDQIDNPYTKSIRKIISNGLKYGSLTTALAFSSYHFFKRGFNNQEPDLNLLGIGTILGIGTFFSGWYTKIRIQKHLPSHISNRKTEKIDYVTRAYNWTRSLRDHVKGTDLVLKDE